MNDKKYYLKYKDEVCLEFIYDYYNKKIKITNIINEYAFIPKNLREFSQEDLKDFLLFHNFIPKTRSNYLKLHKNVTDKFEFYDKLLGLNLNNCLWICSEESNLKWSDINYFDHFRNELFPKILNDDATIFNPLNYWSPDWFTNGEALKSWYQENNQIYLLKSPIMFFNKPLYNNFSEYFASQIGELLLSNAVKYDFFNFENQLLTKSHNFCSSTINYFSFSQLIFSHENIEKHLIELYGENNYEDLMVFDALIFNADRNLGNFGLLYNAESKKFVGPAPIFDFNKSLAYDFPIYQNKIGKQQLENYSKRLTSFYESFDLQLEKFAKPRHKVWVEKLEKFKFKNTSYVKDKKYIKFIKAIIKNQTKKLKKILEGSNSKDI
ncbi:hypothetical protein DA803_00625 [[Mycoplasma] phocae]|uniref:HipA-like kinase domain-containing protein n=1 Tax=[Mycoplasma] phocae TaxID=142651 RepID=A0A2Z5IPQ7_9BACT|nr:HipA family kinase [[Mycoplasma] phocae]AXE60600.1 hypothetical protein DA803_00625 [[Mycoplasma] phocae]